MTATPSLLLPGPFCSLQAIQVCHRPPVLPQHAIEGKATYLLGTRAECGTIKVSNGDSCAALSSRCKTTGAEFVACNTDKSLCATTSGQCV
ncbi:hypothetical protein LX36DRAFT_660936 [Colletotrichum falcatum]|nr:hypothetical protein LX36DRAFT_660936 [Colletotrichum falcatum]